MANLDEITAINKSKIDLVINKIPFLTFLLIVFYMFFYFFNYGFASFFGYPKEFINVNFNSFFSPAFSIYCGFLFAVLTLRFYIDGDGRMSRLHLIVWTVGIIGAMSMFIFESPYSIFRHDNYLFVLILIFSVSLVALFYLVDSIANYRDYIDMRGLVTLVLLVFSIPFSLGWITAHIKGDIYVSNDLYLITKYESGYVFGKCKNQKSDFYIFNPSEINKFTAISNTDLKQIKTCFRLATERVNTINR